MIDLKKRISTAEAQQKKEGSFAVVSGWAEDIKVLGKIAFIKLRDREGYLQLVTTNPDLIKEIEKLTKESVIAAKGKIKKSKLKAGGNELQISSIELLSRAEAKLPIDVTGKVPADLSKRLDWRFLDLRNPKHLLIFKICSDFEKFTRDFFIKNGLIEIHSPKFMGVPSESGAELFSVPYFEKTAYLAQSPQFYKQMAMAAGFEKVFEIGPVFRANPSHTTRHDTEYTSLDVEMSWITWKDLMAFEESWIKYVLEQLKNKRGKEIEKVFGVKIIIPKIPFPRITMKNALKLIKKPGNDLGTEGEKLLAKEILKKRGHEFVFVTEYPWEVRPFYHMKLEGKPNLTKSYDLIYKGVEITTGAQREHRYNILVKQAKEKGLHLKPIQFYLNFFKYGCPPHAGFGLSPTRVITQMLDLGNVREATFAPRDPERLTP